MTTTTEGSTLRRCIGSRTFDIESHEAPASDFPTQPSQKDGLGRMCQPHWTAYTNALRKAVIARKAAETAEVAPVAPVHEHTLAASLLGEGDFIEAPAPRGNRRTKAQAEPEITAG